MTRIQLRYGTLAEWQSNATKQPLVGEVCVVEIPASNTTKVDANGKQYTVTTPPTVLFKVGAKKDDGTLKTFAELPIMSALAADVHDWAKMTEEEFKTYVNNEIQNGKIKFATQAALDALATRVTTLEGTVGDLSSGTVTNVTAKSGNTVLTSTEITKSGTVVTIDDKKIVTSIADAKKAGTDAAAAASTAQAAADTALGKLSGIDDGSTVVAYVGTQKNAIIGDNSSTSTSDTIKGAKKYADEKASAVLGETGDAATANTVYGAKAAATAANTAAGNAQQKADQAHALATANAGEITTIKGQISALDDTYATNEELEDAIDAAKTALIGSDTTANTIKKAIKDAATAQSAADAAQADATSALNKLAVVQGEATVPGSIAKAEADAKAYTDDKLEEFVAAYITDDGGTIDKLNEIAAWIADDEAGAAKVIADVDKNKTDIATNASNITAVSNRVTTIENDYLKTADKTELEGKISTAQTNAVSSANSYTDGKIEDVNDAIDAINTKIARFGEAGDVLVFNCGTASTNW